MTPEEIRLECVKLAFRHDHTAEQIIAKAAELFAFVIYEPTSSSDAPAQATQAEEPKGRKGRGPQTESA